MKSNFGKVMDFVFFPYWHSLDISRQSIISKLKIRRYRGKKKNLKGEVNILVKIFFWKTVTNVLCSISFITTKTTFFSHLILRLSLSFIVRTFFSFLKKHLILLTKNIVNFYSQYHLFLINPTKLSLRSEFWIL